MERSEQINELAAALAKAQGQLKAAPKGQFNPFHKKHYANLAAVRAAMRDAFAENGLSVTQPLSNCEIGIRVTTLLLHSSGQWISSVFELPIDKLDPQRMGSASTYGLRYTLQAITGVAPDDASDDDGNAVRSPEKEKTVRDTLATAVELAKKQHPVTAVTVGTAITGPSVASVAADPHPLTYDEVKYIADASAEINFAAHPEALVAIGTMIREKSEPIRHALRGLYAARMKLLETMPSEANESEASATK